MTRIGQYCREIWPEHPLGRKPRVGDVARYLQKGIVFRAKIAKVNKRQRTVEFEGGDWAYVHELGADRD